MPGLSQWLAETRLWVDHVHEEEISTRPQFATVAEEFTAAGTVQLPTRLAATAKFVTRRSRPS